MTHDGTRNYKETQNKALTQSLGYNLPPILRTGVVNRGSTSDNLQPTTKVPTEIVARISPDFRLQGLGKIYWISLSEQSQRRVVLEWTESDESDDFGRHDTRESDVSLLVDINNLGRSRIDSRSEFVHRDPVLYQRMPPTAEQIRVAKSINEIAKTAGFQGIEDPYGYFEIATDSAQMPMTSQGYQPQPAKLLSLLDEVVTFGQFGVGFSTGLIEIWMLGGKHPLSVFSGHDVPISAFKIYAKGKAISGDKSGKLLLWQTRPQSSEPSVVELMGCEGEVKSVLITREWECIAASDQANQILIWSLNQPALEPYL